MIAQITVGFIAFAAILFLYVIFAQYIRHSFIEGFHNGDPISPSLFVPKVTPGGADEVSKLAPGSAFNTSSEAILDTLPPMSEGTARSNWGKMTSETCYRSDIGEALKKTRNYLQRTNNYQRSHPDSCSAPNHEFVGTFYTPFDGVGRTPESGGDYPPSTEYCTE